MEEPAEAPPDDAEDAAEGATEAPSRSGGGLRVLGALVMLPWLLGYGVIGTWTVVRGARRRGLRASRASTPATRVWSARPA